MIFNDFVVMVIDKINLKIKNLLFSRTSLFIVVPLLIIIAGSIYLIISDLKQSSTNRKNNYVAGLYEDNYVWCGVMKLAWDDLEKNVLHENVKLQTNNKQALDLILALDNEPFSEKDIDSASYYVNAGFGNKIVSSINNDLQKKFPNRTMGDLDENLDDMSFIVYAYLYKDLKFKHPFNKTTVHFNSSSVNGFTADNYDQKENIKVLKYFDDNKFVIKLTLQNDQDELFFVKGYDMKSPDSALEAIVKYDDDHLKSLNPSDIFEAPFVSFGYTRHYNELEGQCFANKGWTDYCIDQMVERVIFNLNDKGAMVEAEAKMVAVGAAPGEDHKTEKIRKFVLNKPFWIILKRKNSNNPYLIIGVNNTSILSVK